MGDREGDRGLEICVCIVSAFGERKRERAKVKSFVGSKEGSPQADAGG